MKLSIEQEVNLEKDIKYLEEKVQKNLNDVSVEEILLLQEKSTVRNKNIENRRGYA